MTPSDGPLSGKVALVTGGGSGIGEASAGELAEAGARVVVVDVDASAATRVADRLGGLAVTADVGRPEAWAGVIGAATRAFGGVDVAHLNAGVTTGEADITLLSDEQYRRIMLVNVDGVVFGIRALVPVLAGRGGGGLVATASLAGLIGYSPDPIYGLTKSAVIGLVRALAPQLADRGITVNAVCPGMVDTPLIDGPMRDALVSSGFPLVDAGAVAGAVLGCLTGGASGQAVVVQVGREPLAYRFARPPGPRGAGADESGSGRLPPEGLAAHDQG